MSTTLSSLIPTLTALGVVLVLIFISGRVVRWTGLDRFSARQRSGHRARMAISETLVLDRARRLHIIRCEGRDLLLLTGGPTDQVVGWVTTGDQS